MRLFTETFAFSATWLTKSMSGSTIVTFLSFGTRAIFFKNNLKPNLKGRMVLALIKFTLTDLPSKERKKKRKYITWFSAERLSGRALSGQRKVQIQVSTSKSLKRVWNILSLNNQNFWPISKWKDLWNNTMKSSSRGWLSKVGLKQKVSFQRRCGQK